MKSSAIRFLAAVALAMMGVGALLHGMGTFAAQSPEGRPWPVHPHAPPVPVMEDISGCGAGSMCAHVVTGTYALTAVVRGVSGTLTSIRDYHLPTFDQRVLSRSADRVEVSVTSRAVVDTQAEFPLDVAQLPAEILPYLVPTSSEQSNDPDIVALARTLTDGAETEAQAVTAILHWVGANILYDNTFSLPHDASAVLRNRSGICVGFSNLSVAMLRAVGIPARKQRGCILWVLPHGGGGHHWIEVYYPDVGWVASEPMGDVNFISAKYIVGTEWEWCGRPETTIQVTERASGTLLYVLRTPHSDTILPLMRDASVPAWDRHPAQVSPSRLTMMTAVSDTEATASLTVEGTDCYSTAWRISSGAPWLDVSATEGLTRGPVLVRIHVPSLTLGLHAATLTITAPAHSLTSTRSVPVQVWVVKDVKRTYLPVLRRR